LNATQSSAIRSDDSGPSDRIAQDHAVANAEFALRLAQPAQYRFDDLRRSQAGAGVKEWRVAHLEVAHVLAPRVLGELVGDLFERGFRLHHRQRDVERAQVVVEGRDVLAGDQHRPELAAIEGRQLDALLARELEHGVEANRSVEVAMQIRLRKTLQ
jgi:hypothetical protein